MSNQNLFETTSLTRRQLLLGAGKFGLGVSALSAMAACAAPQMPSAAPVAEGGAQPATTAETATLRFSVWYGQGDIEVWEAILDRFQEEHPGTEVDFEPLAFAQYWQKLQVGLAAGDPPHAFGMHVGTVYDYAGRNQILSLDSFLERDGVDRSQWFAGLIEEGIWPKPDGDLYALPYRFTGSAFFINKTLFDEAGIPYPEQGWTWPNQYVELARSLTDPANEQWGTLIPGGQLISPFLATNETSPLTEDLRQSNFLDPRVEEVYQFMADLICTHEFAPKPADIQGLGDMFLSGRVAMVPGAQWNIAAYRQIEDFEWDIVYNPLRENVMTPGTYGGPDMLSIPRDMEYVDQAWELVLYATGSPEAQQLMAATAVPTLIAQAADPNFIADQADQGPASYEIIIEQAEHAVGFSFSPAWTEWTQVLNQTITEVYNCNMTVPEALNRIHEEVQQILDEAYENLGV